MIISRTKWIILIFSIIIIIPVILPLFSSFVPGTADGLAHKFRLISFEKSIALGYLRPRWLSDQALGFGSPIFLFNYLLPYYVIAGVHVLGFGVNLSTQIYEALTLIFSFIGMYLLAEKLWGRKGAFVAATVYTYAPYHLLTVFLYEGWGEFTAFVFPPFILYFMVKLFEDFKRDSDKIQNSKFKIKPISVIMNLFQDLKWMLKQVQHDRLQLCTLHFSLLTIVWFLFILSHNVSVVIFSPVLLFLSLIISGFRLRMWSIALASFVIAALISAFFWLPAILMNRLTAYPNLIAQEVAMRGSHFKSLATLITVAITTLQKGTVGYYDFTVGLPILIGVMITGVIIIKEIAQKFSISNFKSGAPWAISNCLFIPIILKFTNSSTWKESPIESRPPSRCLESYTNYQLPITYFIITLFFLFFLSLYLSNYSSNRLWDFSLLHYIVYPFRFLSLATFAGALITGWIARNSLITAFIFVVVAIMAGRPYTNPYIDQFPFDDAYFRQIQTVFDAPGTRKNMATREFLPRWADLQFLKNEEEKFFITKKLPEKFIFEEGKSRVTTFEVKEESMKVALETDKLAGLTVNTFYFPNWKAWLDGLPTVISRDPAGRMTVEVPKGMHKLELRFETSTIEKIGNFISIFGLILFLIVTGTLFKIQL